MKQRIKTMIYWILGIFAILVIFFASGCSIYYPTSYRAFIPKSLDSEYKEYERLCEISAKGIIFSRPIPHHIQNYYTTMSEKWSKETKTTKYYWYDVRNRYGVSVNLISLYDDYSEYKSGKKYHEKIFLPKHRFMILKPYIYFLGSGARIGNTSVWMYSLIDSQTGEIYAHSIVDVEYHTGWRAIPWLSWGYQHKRSLHCANYPKLFSSSIREDTLSYIYKLQSVGDKKDIIFLKEIERLFKVIQPKIQEIIKQEEREEIEW